jgi:TetR/AcrR family transcriptional regulator, transcriptional repressor for nem operon
MFKPHDAARELLPAARSRAIAARRAPLTSPMIRRLLGVGEGRLDRLKAVGHIERTEVVMPRASLKDAIVEAGEVEFHERGFSATGIAAITARACAPKGSFYNHFVSKEDLAVEVLHRYTATQRNEILSDPALSPLDRIRTHFEFVAGKLGSDEAMRGCMVANFAAELSADTPLIREQINGIYHGWASGVAANLEEAAGAQATEFDASGIAWTLVDAYEGATIRSRASGSPAPLKNFIRTTLPLVLASIPTADATG